jgi:hypothetical protein
MWVHEMGIAGPLFAEDSLDLSPVDEGETAGFHKQEPGAVGEGGEFFVPIPRRQNGDPSDPVMLEIGRYAVGLVRLLHLLQRRGVETAHCPRGQQEQRAQAQELSSHQAYFLR